MGKTKSKAGRFPNVGRIGRAKKAADGSNAASQVEVGKLERKRPTSSHRKKSDENNLNPKRQSVKQATKSELHPVEPGVEHGMQFLMLGRGAPSVGGGNKNGSRDDTEVSRTPSNNVVDIEGEEDSVGTSTFVEDETTNSFRGGPSNLSLLPSFKHHELLDIWRNKSIGRAISFLKSDVMQAIHGKLLQNIFNGFSRSVTRMQKLVADDEDESTLFRSMPRVNIIAKNAIAMADAVMVFLSGVEDE
ncbi:hypothetical protein Syun_023105 [Stephania yunnanensis]|uniref:Uncharacterized protein n=1 Tax=Stephania yunnanensis TaxID=152371 RepID=A0AAP0FMU8_9MAGN